MAHARKVVHHFKFWKEDGGFFTCDKADLEAAVASEAQPESEIKRKMGHAFHFLDKALQGLRLTQYEVQHIEYGIRDHGTGSHIIPSKMTGPISP